jgi:4-amino-4-deoxy-L-arabinose transferase-like glycosyltransferase
VRRIPPGLGALLVTSTVLGVTWACVLPAFQAPDEQSHFTYVQTLSELQKLPGDDTRPVFSTQVAQAISAVNSDQVAAQEPVRPEWSDQVEDHWLASQAQAPRDDTGGPSLNAQYPPTAYAWQALGYVAASSGTMFDQLLGARLMSALWMPVSVLATWLLAGEVLGRRRILQTAAAAVPALLPMFAFVSASVSPDGMLFGIWSLALWLGVRCVRRGVPLLDGALFFALVGLACTIKTTSYALLPAAAVVVLVGLLARRPFRVAPSVRLAAVVVLPLLVTFGVWLLIASAEDRQTTAALTQSVAPTGSPTTTNWRELLSYLWQYYLPRTPVQQEYRIPPGGYPVLQVWITQGWGAFGWLEIKYDPWVYRVLALLTTGVFGAAVLALVRARRRIDVRVLAFLAAAFLALFAGLHWTDYHQLEAGALGFMQGRYAFPVIAIFGLALAGAISMLPARRRGIAVGAVVAGLLIFHVSAVGLILERFYA